MSKEEIRKSHTYKSSAESILFKLLTKLILLVAASLGFTFFCLFSHVSIDELTNKYINLFSAFILFIVFIIGWMFFIVFSFLAYRIGKKHILERGTPIKGKIMSSQMVRKRGSMLYSFTVRLEDGKYFYSETYNDDHFKNDNCSECTVYSYKDEYAIGEFIEIATQNDEKKDEKPDNNKEGKKEEK